MIVRIQRINIDNKLSKIKARKASSKFLKSPQINNNATVGSSNTASTEAYGSIFKHLYDGERLLPPNNPRFVRRLEKQNLT